MDRSKCSIVVTGGTGKQGGAVARKLVADGWDVCALVRDPDKPAARALAGIGVNLHRGDLEDPESIERILKGAYGVFGVQSWADGVEAEEREGKALADAAAAAKVEQFVYSSVGAADRGTGVPHFESKGRIEQHIHQIGLPFTIFRPVYFMENLLWQRDSICSGSIEPPIDPDVPLQLIAVEDIAAFVALAFRSPGGWLGHTTEIAGDERTFRQVADAFAALLGRTVDVHPVVRPAQPERQQMASWFEAYGFEADIEKLRTIVPTLHTLPQWASKAFACTPLGD